jgi:hypothetical protein
VLVQWYVVGLCLFLFTNQAGSHSSFLLLSIALCANVGQPQFNAKYGYTEEMLITIGDDANNCRRYLKQDEIGDWSYSATDVIDYLLSEYKESGMMKQDNVTAFVRK